MSGGTSQRTPTPGSSRSGSLVGLQTRPTAWCDSGRAISTRPRVAGPLGSKAAKSMFIDTLTLVPSGDRPNWKLGDVEGPFDLTPGGKFRRGQVPEGAVRANLPALAPFRGLERVFCVPTVRALRL